MLILWIIPAMAALFLLYIFIRAARFVPAKEAGAAAPLPVEADEKALGEHLGEMLRRKTVSYAEEGLADQAQFDSFRALLKELYPNVFKRFECERIGHNGLLLRLAGQGKAEPSVLMAHYDVVPADQAEWSVPAFEGLIRDGEVWGRGAVDTKCTVLGIMEAAEGLAREGFIPKGDLYISLGGDEECLGTDASAIVDALKLRGVRPGFVLDEGGAVVENVFPGVSKPAALIGIAEKGSVFLDITAAGKSGHASAPPAKQAVGVLADALRRVVNKPMPFTLTGPALELFDTLGRHSTFLYRIIFANLNIFAPVLDLICRKSGGELNALVRTTAALTRLSAADAYNVLPNEARAGINLRLIPGDTIADAAGRIEKAIGDAQVKVEVRNGSEPSKVSLTGGEPWERLKAAIRQTYTEAIVSPYLMVAASDSRHFCRVSDHVYRFSGMPLSRDQRGMIHGKDERVPLKLLPDLTRFYVRVMRQC